MKKLMKKCSVLLVFVMVAAAALTGCGKPKLKADKAVDAWLKAELKGEFDEYAKLLGVNVKEVEADYNANIEAVKETFEETEVIGEEAGEELIDIIKELLAGTKYEVGSASEDDKGDYTVDVTIYPSNAMSLYLQKMIDASMVADENTDIGAMAVQMLREAVDEQEAGEGETYQIRITYDEDAKQYEFNEDDTTKLMEGLFSVEDIMGDVFGATGTVYDEPLFNWTPEEWSSASEEDRTQCCLKIIQELQGLSDDDMAMIDLEDEEVQASIQDMKDGIDMSYDGGMQMSIGDYVEFMKEQMSSAN